MPRVIDALCIDGLRPADSPVSKAAFAKQQVINYVKRVVVQTEAQVAAQTARDAANAAAESQIVIM